MLTLRYLNKLGSSLTTQSTRVPHRSSPPPQTEVPVSIQCLIPEYQWESQEGQTWEGKVSNTKDREG